MYRIHKNCGHNAYIVHIMYIGDVKKVKTFNQKEYIKEYAKNNTSIRKMRLSKEDDEKLGKYLDHIGQGYSELVRNLILEDMHKNGWKELINPPKKKE